MFEAACCQHDLDRLHERPIESSTYSSQILDVLGVLGEPAAKVARERAQMWDEGISPVDVQPILQQSQHSGHGWCRRDPTLIYESLLHVARLAISRARIPESAEDIVGWFIAAYPKWVTTVAEWASRSTWEAAAKRKVRQIAIDRIKHYARFKRKAKSTQILFSIQV